MPVKYQNQGTGGGGGGTITGGGIPTQVAFWTGATSIGGDSAFYWDNINKRLGIGTTAPKTHLQIDAADDDEFIRLQFSTRVGIYAGIIDPNVVVNATKGSLYLSSLGSTWVNTDGATGWTDLAGGGGGSGWTDDGIVVRLTTSTDNVGIGTALPASKLHVFGDTDEVQFIVQGNAVQTSNVFVARTSASVNLVTIDNSGNLRPGTDDTQELGSPTLRWSELYLGPATFHIGTSATDEARMTYIGSVFNIFSDPTGNADISFFTDDLYLDKSSGFIGINNVLPAARLHITGADDNEFIRLESTGDSVGIYSGDNDPNVTPVIAQAGSLFLRTNGSTWVNTDGITAWTDLAAAAAASGWTDDGIVVRLTTSTDNVGIGTAAPTAKLHILGDTDEVQLRVQGNVAQTSDILIIENSAGTDLVTFTNLGSIRPGTNNTQDIGSNTLRWMDIFLGPGTLHIGTSELDEGFIYYDTATNIFHFETDVATNGDIAFFTDDLYLDKSTARIGVGTTTPSARLTVEQTSQILLGTEILSAFTLMVDPTANSAGTFIGGNFNVEVDTANTFNVGTIFGIRGGYTHLGTGTITNGRGIAGLIINGDTGIVTNADAFITSIANTSTGTLTTVRGFRATAPSNAGGTITDYYGFYADTSAAATNNYGAYFGNFVGINELAPAKALHITGVSNDEFIRFGITADSTGIFSGSADPNGSVAGEAGSIFLRSNGTLLVNTNGATAWTSLGSGTGDVVGPASSTDNAVVRWDGATGKLIQDSGVFITDGNQIQNVVGSAAVPSISFQGDLDTGIFSSAAGSVDVSLDAFNNFQIRRNASTLHSPLAVGVPTAGSLPQLLSSSIYLGIVVGSQLDGQYDGAANGAIILSARTSAAPATPPTLAPFTVLGPYDAGTFAGTGAGTGRVVYYGGGGWGSPDANRHEFYVASAYTETIDTGILALHIASNTQLRGAAGTAALPTWTFEGDSDTGIFSNGANNLGFATAGVLRLDIDGTDIISTLPYRSPLGTAAAPTYSFSGDTNTGIFSAGADTLNASTAGVSRMAISSLGNTSFTGRVSGAKGADIASASTITFGNDGNVFDITGVTTINHITTTNWPAGSILICQFDSALTVTHNAGAPPANTAPILLAGAVDWSATAGDSLTFYFDGTNWRESARTVV